MTERKAVQIHYSSRNTKVPPLRGGETYSERVQNMSRTGAVHIGNKSAVERNICCVYFSVVQLGMMHSPSESHCTVAAQCTIKLFSLLLILYLQEVSFSKEALI